MSSAARWTIAIIVVVAGLAVALWTFPRAAEEDSANARSSRTAPSVGAGAGTEGGSGAESAPPNGDQSDPFAAIELINMADGTPTSVKKIADGKPVVLNLWAYWCQPCRKELPVLEEVAELLAAKAPAKQGSGVKIVLAHADPGEQQGRELLSELGIRLLPSVLDAKAALGPAAGAPAVLPMTIFVQAHGEIAAIAPHVYRNAAEVLADIDKHFPEQNK